MTSAKKLHSLFEKMKALQNADSEITGKVLAGFGKDVTGVKDDGASFMVLLASLLDQTDKSLKAADLDNHHLQNYLDAFKRAKKLVSPNVMAWRWGDFKAQIEKEQILSNLLMIDFVLGKSPHKSIDADDLKEISEELDSIRSMIGEAELPRYARSVLELELEKIRQLLKSELLFSEQEFYSLYSSLTAKILATSELFRSNANAKNIVLRMIARLRGGLALSADSAQVVDATVKVIAIASGGQST